MNKIIIILVIISSVIVSSYSAVKVNISLQNPGINENYFKMDVVLQILPGQYWRVGSSNIRIDWVTEPSNSVSVKEDSAVIGALNCNNLGIRTTSISGGTAISFNIIKLGGATCRLNPGTYTLGMIRFNRIDTTGCITLTIRPTSILYDSLTLWAYGTDWTLTNPTPCIRIDYLTGITNSGNNIPKEFKLYTNYPNPFNPSTTIKFDVPRYSYVSLVVFDLLGKEITKLVNGNIKAGSYEVVWEAINFASSTYFYKFTADQYTDIKKMTLIK
jgi:hypothetical protein